MRGRSISLSPSSRVRNDFLHFANKVPLLPVQRRMALGPLIAARAASPHRPPLTALFVKGFALLAQQVPELRRAYIGFPWPHLYEYPASVAMVAFDRDTADGPAVFGGRIKEPANLPLREIADLLRAYSEMPLAKVRDFRRVAGFARLPGPLRRLLIYIVLNFGRLRANYFGTFVVSVYSALGADSLRPLFPSTVVLNYGVIAPDGSVDVRFVYDHRVLDGGTVARALRAFEEILTGALVDEIRAWR
jgi:hypothetical protein